MTAKLFKVKVNGQHELTVDASEGTLLDALEKHQLEVHYHCKSGFCGACRSKLKSGSVRYFTPDDFALGYPTFGACLHHVANRRYINTNKGERLLPMDLPCCCVPESDLDIEH